MSSVPLFSLSFLPADIFSLLVQSPRALYLQRILDAGYPVLSRQRQGACSEQRYHSNGVSKRVCEIECLLICLSVCMCKDWLLTRIYGERHEVAVRMFYVMPEMMATTGRYNDHPRSHSFLCFDLDNVGLRPSVLSISMDQHVM